MKNNNSYSVENQGKCAFHGINMASTVLGVSADCHS